MSEPSLPAEVLSAVSDTCDPLDLGLSVSDLVGDALKWGFVEARWFTALCGSVTLLGQALFVINAIRTVVAAGEYQYRFAEAIGAAAGTVAFARREPVPAAPGDLPADLGSYYRSKAFETQRAIRSTFAHAKEVRGLGTSGPLAGALVPIVQEYWVKQAAALAGVLVTCRRSPAEAMDKLFHSYAFDLAGSMGEPYDGMIRRRHYGWPPLYAGVDR
jgi:hypothetical protein